MLKVNETSSNTVHSHFSVFLDSVNIGHLCVLSQDSSFIQGAFGTPNPELCPEDIQRALKRYVEEYIRPPMFLHRVLCNDLAGATATASYRQLYLLKHIVAYVEANVSREMHGSFVVVNQHLEKRRLPSCNSGTSPLDGLNSSELD